MPIKTCQDHSPTTGSAALPDRASPAKVHLPCLDGLRGWSALAVFLAHAQILTHCGSLPFERLGSRAVDFFLLLSGYLLVSHYCTHRSTAPWQKPGTWVRFWVQRYLRIAPIYYVMVTLAVLLTPLFIWGRTYLAGIWPMAITDAARYQAASLGTYLSHLSFYFAFQPVHQVSTVIPSWTVALEIQFYLVFPFVMLLFERLGPALAGGMIIGVGWLLLYNKQLYPDLDFMIILLKSLHIFVIGIWCALGNENRQQRRFVLASALVLLLSVPFEGMAVAAERLICVLLFFYLVDQGGLPMPAHGTKWVERVRSFLGSRFSGHLGENSYGVYLIHMILLLPLASLLAHSNTYLNFDGRIRFFLCVLIVIFPVYAIAGLLQRTVELPCIRFGRMLAGRSPSS